MIEKLLLCATEDIASGGGMLTFLELRRHVRRGRRDGTHQTHPLPGLPCHACIEEDVGMFS